MRCFVVFIFLFLFCFFFISGGFLALVHFSMLDAKKGPKKRREYIMGNGYIVFKFITAFLVFFSSFFLIFFISIFSF